MAHPFLLLADIGVQIGESLRAELVQQDRYLRGLSEAPYFAVKASGATQRVRYHLRGLFQKRPS